jgi:hypothetical protein
MPDQPLYRSQVLDHLGLIAGMFDELGIGEIRDQATHQNPELRDLTVGEAVKAMVLNGLGFINQALYLPTLSTLSGRNLVKTADSCSEQAQDFDLHVVEAFDELMHLALHRHPDAGNAFQQLAHPPQGGCHGRLVDVVRHRLVLACSLLTHAALCHRVNQQGEGHHHQQPVDPAGLFDKPRGDKKQGVFEKAKAAFDG